MTICVKGVAVGAITVVAALIVLSMLMPLVFSHLVRTGSLDVLIVSTGPQIYTLAAILFSGVLGIYIGAVVAGQSAWANSISVTLAAFLVTFVLNQPASEWSTAYPAWFTVTSYFVVLTSLLLGHHVAKRLMQNKT